MNTAVDFEDLLQQAACAICERKMAVPAVLLLESHKPLTGLMHAAALVSSPLLAVLLGSKWQRLLPLLESKQYVERLIALIETFEEQRRTL